MVAERDEQVPAKAESPPLCGMIHHLMARNTASIGTAIAEAIPYLFGLVSSGCRRAAPRFVGLDPQHVS